MKPEREAAEEQAAREYADAVRSSNGHDVYWPAWNQRIIDRWSVTALLRIKRRAWLLVYSRDL